MGEESGSNTTTQEIQSLNNPRILPYAANNRGVPSHIYPPTDLTHVYHLVLVSTKPCCFACSYHRVDDEECKYDVDHHCHSRKGVDDWQPLVQIRPRLCQPPAPTQRVPQPHVRNGNQSRTKYSFLSLPCVSVAQTSHCTRHDKYILRARHVPPTPTLEGYNEHTPAFWYRIQRLPGNFREWCEM